MILLERSKLGRLRDAEEYRARIVEHLQHRDTPVVHLIWRGHVQALLEWNFITQETFNEIVPLLKTTDYAESRFPFIRNLERDPKTGLEIIPETNEFRKIVAGSLFKSADDQCLQILWRGYLGALQEHIGFEGFAYSAVRDVLDDDLATDEMSEMFLGVGDE